MMDWFTSLDEREQRFVLAAAVAVVSAALYLGAWLPLNNAHKQLQSSVALWEDSLEKLKPLKGRINRAGATRISPSNLNQPLVVVVDSTMQKHQLNSAHHRSQPTGSNIRVEFENASFDDLVLWLGDLNSQYALQVQSGTFSTTNDDDSGRVNAQLTLGR